MPPVNATVAAVDCGTNSTRLLIARRSPGGDIEAVDRQMRITGLGRGVDQSRRLADGAVERTLAVLRDYAARIGEAGVASVRAVATSAVRDAANGTEFLAGASAALGWPVAVISGQQEAEASFEGATAGLDPSLAPYLVVDIGGGSTEVVVGSSDVEQAMSLDVGCVRITERFLHHDPPGPDELSAALSYVTAHLDDVSRCMPTAVEATTLVGLAGTVSTTAAVEIGLDRYDVARLHGFVLTKDAVEDVFRTLATEAADDRRHNPGLEPGRVDTIVGGLCVLVSVLRRLGFDRLVVSESDILDGLVANLLRDVEPRRD